jgi:glycerophosphoryl diester phosphodiesterase
VHPWTINEPDEIERFVASGVASITTDDPETALLLRNATDIRRL